jgi:hypothetical protein
MMRLIVLVALCGVARADVSTGAAPKEGAAAVRLLAPWRKCPALNDTIPFGDELPHVSAKPTPEGALAFVSDEGSGRDAVGVWVTLRLMHGRCDARGWETAGPKEWVESGLRRVAKGGAAPPTLAEIAAWSEAQLVGEANRDVLAAARLVVRLSAEDSEWRAQPEHAGRPRGSPAAIWTPEMLRAAGIDRPWRADDDGRFDALYHARVREPRLLVKKAGFEIWELRWRARNGGGIVAVYDRARDRHRWLWGTHGDRPGRDDTGPPGADSFMVERFEGDKLVLRTEFERVITRVSINLRSGAIKEARSPAGRSARWRRRGGQPTQAARRSHP